MSPSRISDFKLCPQLFKFRVIDRLPEPEDPYSAKGSLVHAALEGLFGLAPGNRTLANATERLRLAWDEIKGAEEFDLPLTEEQEAAFLQEAQGLLANYFRLERPALINTHELEWWVEHQTPTALLRGIIDRVEVDEDGDWILTDYKTGRAPSETYALGSFFALKFYALVCWRAFGKIPKALRLVHLREPEVLTLHPDQRMLEALERQLEALAKALTTAFESGVFKARPGRVCARCPHQQICPFAQKS